MVPRNYSIVFPGQGSQTVGMLGDLFSKYPELKETFDEASEVLGYDLEDVVNNGPVERLNQTHVTQPALLAASVAVWRIWSKRISAQPLLLAGHSLGEYTALVCAKALLFRDAVKCVEARGALMQRAYPGQGGMLAIIGLTDTAVTKICEEASRQGFISIANYNSVGQVVVAGEMLALETAMGLAKIAGAKLAKILPVSIPAHTILMQEGAESLRLLLEQLDLQRPEIPVLQNAEIKIYDTVDEIRQALVKQLYLPVNWVETVHTLVRMGSQAIFECGPGKVLTGLNKRIVSEITVDFLGNSEHLAKYLA